MDDPNPSRRTAPPLGNKAADSPAELPHPPLPTGTPQARLSIPNAGIVPADLFVRMQQFVSRSICRLFVPQNINPGGGSAALILAGTGLGTGFLIDTDRVLTCRHVGYPKGGTLVWTDLRIEFPACCSDEVYSIAEVLYDESPQLDFAVLRLHKVPTDASGRPLRPLPFNDRTLASKLTNTSIRMLGYSHREGSGDRRLYLAAHGMVKAANPWQVHYECETLGGNSGSPVFGGENWTVVAMHANAGDTDTAAQEVTHNCGIPIRTVWGKVGPKLYPTADSYKVMPIQPSEFEASSLHTTSLSVPEATPLLGFPPVRREETCPRHELPPLIERLASAPFGTRLALWGMGGVGKSTLVREAISDPRVSSRFAFMYWISLHEKTTKEELISVLSAFHRTLWPSQLVPKVDSVRDFALQLQISWRQYKPAEPPLVVVDNVWSKEDSEMFENVPVTLIITARTRNLANAFCIAPSDIIIPVALLSDVAQDRMLLQLSRVPGDKDEKARSKVLACCGGLPLAINIVARMVRKRKADKPWQDALRLFHSHRIGKEALTRDTTVYTSLLTSSTFLDECLAAHWSSLCVFPAERWVPEGLVHLLWRVKEPKLERPDVHEQLEELFECGLVELGEMRRRVFVRLHAVMHSALLWKLADVSLSSFSAQMQQIPPLDVLKLIWMEDWRQTLDLDKTLVANLLPLQAIHYDGWKAIEPAQIERMIRTADDESTVALLTLDSIDHPCMYPDEQWLAATQGVEPREVADLIMQGNLAGNVFANRYKRWPEVLEALTPTAICGLVQSANPMILLDCFDGYKRWDEVWALLEPTHLARLFVAALAPLFIHELSKRGFKRWDILEPTEVAGCLLSSHRLAPMCCWLLAREGYTRWEEVDDITGPEIAQQRREY